MFPSVAIDENPSMRAVPKNLRARASYARFPPLSRVWAEGSFPEQWLVIEPTSKRALVLFFRAVRAKAKFCEHC